MPRHHLADRLREFRGTHRQPPPRQRPRSPWHRGSDVQETGAWQGASIVAQQALHSAGLLHANDTSPMRLYAGGGDITGLTLFSPKAVEILAANGITDVALYIQNVRTGDVSIVSAGRDIVPNNPNAALRSSPTTSRSETSSAISPSAPSLAPPRTPFLATSKSTVPAPSKSSPGAISISAPRPTAPTAPASASPASAISAIRSCRPRVRT